MGPVSARTAAAVSAATLVVVIVMLALDEAHEVLARATLGASVAALFLGVAGALMLPLELSDAGVGARRRPTGRHPARNRCVGCCGLDAHHCVVWSR